MSQAWNVILSTGQRIYRKIHSSKFDFQDFNVNDSATNLGLVVHINHSIQGNACYGINLVLGRL